MSDANMKIELPLRLWRISWQLCGTWVQGCCWEEGWCWCWMHLRDF